MQRSSPSVPQSRTCCRGLPYKRIVGTAFYGLRTKTSSSQVAGTTQIVFNIYSVLWWQIAAGAVPETKRRKRSGDHDGALIPAGRCGSQTLNTAEISIPYTVLSWAQAGHVGLLGLSLFGWRGMMCGWHAVPVVEHNTDSLRRRLEFAQTDKFCKYTSHRRGATRGPESQNPVDSRIPRRRLH